MVLRILTLFFATAVCNEIRPRVVGGRDADITTYPYTVMLISPFILSNGTLARIKGCTGSLISELWVITAGHCGARWIRYPDTSVPFEQDTMFIEVIENIPFQGIISYGFMGTGNWHHINERNDIKMLKLRQKAIVKSYGKISVVDHGTLIGKPAVSIGFGMTHIVPLTNTIYKYIGDRMLANNSIPLQYGDMIVSKCPQIRTFGPNICVSPVCKDRNVQIGPGDSGSPLLVDGMIVGVGAHTAEGVNAYTVVSPYINWIHSVFNGNNKKLLFVFQLQNFI